MTMIIMKKTLCIKQLWNVKSHVVGYKNYKLLTLNTNQISHDNDNDEGDTA